MADGLFLLQADGDDGDAKPGLPEPQVAVIRSGNFPGDR
jgi:hypothetical protein